MGIFTDTDILGVTNLLVDRFLKVENYEGLQAAPDLSSLSILVMELPL